jgi:CRP/FNR family cyclic AMP-dependent transcriptional regulator
MVVMTPSKEFIRIYQKSEVIFEENAIGDEMYVVCSGKVRLSTTAPGREVVLGTLGPGELFGEMALVDSNPRSATAIAVEDNTRLAALNQQRFLYLVGQQPAFALTIMHALCLRIRERWELFSELLKKSDEGAESLDQLRFN